MRFQIEQVNYDLIRNARNISERDKNKLVGFTQRYIAAVETDHGYHVLMETLGDRDECLYSLQNYLQRNPAGMLV
jgi:hypothetical protein